MPPVKPTTPKPPAASSPVQPVEPPKTEQVTVPEGALIITREGLEQLKTDIAAEVLQSMPAPNPVHVQGLIPDHLQSAVPKPTAEEVARAEARAEQIRDMLADEEAHVRKCPAGPRAGGKGRVEAFEAIRPAGQLDTQDPPVEHAVPTRVTVIRCLMCGGDAILEGSPETHDL